MAVTGADPRVYRLHGPNQLPPPLNQLPLPLKGLPLPAEGTIGQSPSQRGYGLYGVRPHRPQGKVLEPFSAGPVSVSWPVSLRPGASS
jgi:hypothetical protein